MNWKRVARACMCLLVVCCVLLNVCAIPAKASMVVAGTGTLIVASALPAIKAILIGLGVGVGLAVASPAYTAMVEGVHAHLIAQGLATDTTISLLGFEVNGTMVTGAPTEVIAAIWDYLWSSGTLQQSDIVVSGTGVSLVSTSSAPQAAKDFWASVPLYDLAQSAADGHILLLASEGSSLPNQLYGLRRWTSAAGYKVLGACTTNASGTIQPYTTANFPIGAFAKFSDFSVGNSFSGFTYSSYAHTVFCSYADAYSAYMDSGVSLSYYFYLTPESYIVPGYTSAASTGFTPCGFARIVNAGYISSGGQVVETSFYLAYSSGYDSIFYTFVPSDIATETVNQSTVGDSGQIADPDEELSIGYPAWFGNGTTVINPETQIQTQVVPIPNVNTNTDFSTLTQEEVWAGQLSDAIVDANTGTVAGTPIGDFWAGLTNAIVTPLLEGIASIFIPSEDFVTAKFEALRAEFAFADSIMGTAELFVPLLQGLEPVPPVIYIDLGASTGDYDFGGKVAFVDLRWYAEYKPTVDALLSAFMWLVFLWRVFIRLPGIISGVPFFVPDSIVPNGEEKSIVVQRWN